MRISYWNGLPPPSERSFCPLESYSMLCYWTICLDVFQWSFPKHSMAACNDYVSWLPREWCSEESTGCEGSYTPSACCRQVRRRKHPGENSLTLPFCLSLIRDGEFCSLDLHSLSSPARMVFCFREWTPSVGSLWFLFGWKNLCWVFLCELSFFLLAIFYTFWFPPDQWTLLRLWFLGPMFFFFVYLSLMESVGGCGFFSQRQLLNTKGPVCLNPFFFVLFVQCFV